MRQLASGRLPSTALDSSTHHSRSKGHCEESLVCFRFQAFLSMTMFGEDIQRFQPLTLLDSGRHACGCHVIIEGVCGTCQFPLPPWSPNGKLQQSLFENSWIEMNNLHPYVAGYDKDTSSLSSSHSSTTTKFELFD